MFADIGREYLRWRHSHGYGVHSPFAYNIVKMAIRPGNKYAYYGYYDIDLALEGKRGQYPALRKDAMLLLRLLVTLRSRRLILFPSRQAAFEAAGKGAGVKVCLASGNNFPEPEPGDFFIASNECPDSKEIRRLLSAGTTVMAILPSPSCRKEIAGFNAKGLLLEGKRIILAIPNPGMAFVSYHMKF